MERLACFCFEVKPSDCSLNDAGGSLPACSAEAEILCPVTQGHGDAGVCPHVTDPSRAIASSPLHGAGIPVRYDEHSNKDKQIDLLMVIGVVTATISLPDAHSLKDKRQVIRSLKDRILGKMNVSVAEVGKQDKWQISELAFVTVAADSEIVQSRISEISSFIRSTPRYIVLDLHTEMM